MLMSDAIAEMINNLLRESNGSLEIKRNDLAEKMGCVPSQINYVITSRFTPERGYIIESRRGGGGYIRIIKKEMHKDEYLMHSFYAIGDAIDAASAAAIIRNLADNKLITAREQAIMLGAVSPKALEKLASGENIVRADIMRQQILALMK
ncbi:MAG: CtsR family transcriptional regulator [Clostridia bacterium]|nr:CtsR family transcriptional regulator [Clostridia bacterium]MBQ4574571.1 CtsR family transcriptional regulator [Clostridia bacterium]